MPRFGKAPDELVRMFENALRDFPMAQQRKMFGFPAAFINGNMFAGLFNDKMIVRLSPAVAANMRDAEPFEPMPGRAMRGWVVVPQAALGSASELNALMEKALEYTKALPTKGKKR